jgi:hypothetical protein
MLLALGDDTKENSKQPSWSSSKCSFTDPLVGRHFAQRNIVPHRSITEDIKAHQRVLETELPLP